MKRDILKTSDLFEDFLYPQQSWSLPSWVIKNEDFIEVLKDVISNNTEDDYRYPNSYEELFSYLKAKQYAVFEDRFVVCLSQGRLAYLTSSGFSKVSATEDLFMLENWKIRG